MHRRRFFGTSAGLLATLESGSLLKAGKALDNIPSRPADTVARDEDFWFNVRHAFTVDRNMINLNNGGVYMEVEALALSRDVPVSLRFIVDPIVRRVSRNSLIESLQQTGRAVNEVAVNGIATVAGSR